MEKVIRFETISNELRSRSAARKIFSDNASQGDIMNFVLDFSNIYSISRSFADEVYEFINLIGKNKVCIKNTEPNISLTLEIVEKNRGNKRDYKVTGDVESFEDIDSLKDFLLTI